MVLTGAVRSSRRGVLLTGAAGLTLAGAGCGLFDSDPPPPPAPDKLLGLYESARAQAAEYRRVITALPGLAAWLTPLADAHQAHADALAAILDPAPVTSGAPPFSVPPSDGPGGSHTTDQKQAVETLRNAELQGAKEASTACRQAPAERATLVGSIAAARATHAEVLR